jgi:glutathione peroxidase-family protein
MEFYKLKAKTPKGEEINLADFKDKTVLIPIV